MYEAKLTAGQAPIQVMTDTTPFGINDESFSSLTKLLRVTAWVPRFIGKLRKQSAEKVSLSVKEIDRAKLLWDRQVQERNFSDVITAIKENRKNNLQAQLGLRLDDKGLLRCHGRLGNAELSQAARTPKLFPKKDHFSNLVIESYHRQLLHSSSSQTLSQIRQEYWIPQGRAAIKRVLKACGTCRRHEGGPLKMPVMPPLPLQRVAESAPFTYVGLDYLGPLYVKEASNVQKVWVCLFTCLTVRAVHLELISDMSAEQFIICLRRFIARRGKPKRVISDNAPQFKLSKTVLDRVWENVILSPDVRNHVADKGIEWHFNIELAPWMGGFYERLVGLVKRSLRKAIGKVCLTCEQLQTVLIEAEAVVNCRPLVYIDDDINSQVILAPSDFLRQNCYTGIPQFEDDAEDPDYLPSIDSAEMLLQTWKQGQKHLTRFWNIWRDEYLLRLRERKQTHLRGPRVKIPFTPKAGDVVLVKDDLPRAAWRLGKILELIPSWDGEKRAARILLHSKRILNRPLCLLYPIECPEMENMDKLAKSVCSEKEVNLETPLRCRPVRRAAVQATKRLREQLE